MHHNVPVQENLPLGIPPNQPPEPVEVSGVEVCLNVISIDEEKTADNCKDELCKDELCKDEAAEALPAETPDPPSRDPALRTHQMAAREAHCVLIHCLCGCLGLSDAPPDDKGVPAAAQHWFVKHNPVYWGLWLVTAFFIWQGCHWHCLWGQGKKSRPDETQEEAEVRIHWIYCCDGMYLGCVILDLFDLLLDWIDYGLSWNTEADICGALCYVVAVAVYIGLLGGNLIFINAMQIKSEVRLRACIVANLAFGIFTLTMLLISAFTGKGSDSVTSAMAWMLRLAVVIGYVIVGLYYTRLWKIYHPVGSNLHWDVDQDGVEDSLHIHLKHCSVCRAILPATITFGVLLFVFILEPDAVWVALTG